MNHSASLMATRNAGQHQDQSHNQQKQQQQYQLQIQTFNGKSLLDKDNLRDDDFDKLVVDISKLVDSKSSQDCQNDLIECRYNYPVASGEKEFANSSCSNSPSRSDVCNRLNQQPKRPMNAFMVWGRAIRREIHLRFSNVQNALLSKALGRVWRSLDSAAKEPYVRRANLIKANHRRDYPDYRYQPRRLAEKEKTKTDDGDAKPISGSTKLNCDSSQSTAPSTRTGFQSATTIRHYPTINGGEYATHRRIEFNTGSRRSNASESNSLGPVTPSHQYYASNLACQDNNNHINSQYKNGIYPTSSTGDEGGSSGGMFDDIRVKAQYYNECQQQQQQHQQHRSPSSCKQQQQNPAAAVYSYHPGPYQHQHQFAYNMQFHQHQQQQEHTYQQFSLHASMPQQPDAGNSEVARMSYVESCSLSVVSPGGLDIGNRLQAAPSTMEMNGNGFSRSYETRE